MRRFFRRLLTQPVARPAAPRPRSFKPGVTGLEDRVTPTTYTVLNTFDSGGGSLRQAVLDSNTAGGTNQIVFDPSFLSAPHTINLTTGQMAITASVTITGPGANLLTVNGSTTQSTTNRIFNITGTPLVTIAGLTMAQGNISGVGARNGFLPVNIS